MQQIHSAAYITLLLAIIVSIIAEISSMPRSDSYYGDYYPEYPQSGARQADALIPSLKTGYYYIDNGAITPVKRSQAIGKTSSARRRYDYDDGDAAVRFTPLVRYRQTRANRRRLFVPNLFG